MGEAADVELLCGRRPSRPPGMKRAIYDSDLNRESMPLSNGPLTAQIKKRGGIHNRKDTAMLIAKRGRLARMLTQHTVINIL